MNSILRFFMLLVVWKTALVCKLQNKKKKIKQSATVKHEKQLVVHDMQWIQVVHCNKLVYQFYVKQTPTKSAIKSVSDSSLQNYHIKCILNIPA